MNIVFVMTDTQNPAHGWTCAELQAILDSLPVPFRWDESSETIVKG